MVDTLFASARTRARLPLIRKEAHAERGLHDILWLSRDTANKTVK